MVNTPTANRPAKPKKGNFKHNFAQSNYITAAWNWFMVLAGKAAEPVLTISVLYSCARLLPAVHIPVQVDNIVFVAQMVALDVGGLSLGKMAKAAQRAGNAEGATLARRVSIALISIMIANVVLSVLQTIIPSMPGQLVAVVEAILLIARAVMAVLYAHVIHSLKRDHGNESESSVSGSASLDDWQMIGLTAHLMQTTLASIPPVDVEALTEAITRRVEAENTARFEAMHHQLEATSEAITRQVEATSEARVEAKIRELEARMRQRVTVSEAAEPPQMAPKPTRETPLRMLPLRQAGAPLTEKRVAVYRLIEQDDNLSSYAISEQTGIPVSTVQRYLKDWKTRLNEAESEATGTDE
jgi:hypothetical protein